MSQFSISDDMLQFAHQLNTDDHNCKAYRKRNTAQGHRKRGSVNPNRHNESLELIPLHQLQHHKREQSVEKTQRTTQVLSTKRFSSTAGVKKRSQRVVDANQLSFMQTGRTKLPSSYVESPSELCPEDAATVKWNQISRPPGRFVQKERELARKGQLQNKHFQEWLNHALLESCRDEKFDRTIEYPALKKFGIDKNSLLSKGVNPDNLNRIFKALFVYSMGFNTLLREMGGSHIQKALWKVYAVLLEYSSDGDFETMIGEIERDKVSKMESLREEIERRQEVIDNNEEIHQEKNAKIFKELKLLREANLNLENDKQVLMEDYKEAEQAFNEEVSLRLKFENKINEIHGVHHELTIKHQKLYDDLTLNKRENAELKRKNSELTENYIRTKNSLEQEMKDSQQLRDELMFNSQQTSIFKQKNGKFEMKDIEWQHKMEEMTAAIHLKGRKVEQVSKELQNTELMLKLKDQSEKQLQKEYQRALEENKSLVQSLQLQLQELNRHMLQKKQFNDTHSRLHAEIAIANRALQSRQSQIEESRRAVKELRIEINQQQIELESIGNKNRQLQEDLEDSFMKMEEMKKIKNAVEDEVGELNMKLETYTNYYHEKEKEIGEKNQLIEDLERRVAEFAITKRTLDSKIALLNQKIASDEEINSKKILKIEQELTAVEKERVRLKEQLEVRREEVVKYMQLYDETMSKIKDHVFERNDLELKYTQSLNVVESETGHIKHLNIKISEMEERIEEASRQFRAQQIIMEGKERAFQIETTTLNKNIDMLKGQVRSKKGHIHPMLFEDAAAKVSQCEEKNEELREEMGRILASSREVALKAEVERLRKVMEAEKNSFEKELEVREKQLGEEKERGAQMKKELQLAILQANEQKTNESFKKKELKYLQFIKEKSARIEELLQEVQKMQDTNNNMIKTHDNMELRLKEQEAAIQQMEKEKVRLEREKKAIEEERKHFVKEKQALQARIEELGKRRTSEEEERRREKGDRVTFSQEEGSRQSNSKQGQRGASKDEERKKRHERVEWRTDFVKKHTNACNYYNK